MTSGNELQGVARRIGGELELTVVQPFRELAFDIGMKLLAGASIAQIRESRCATWRLLARINQRLNAPYIGRIAQLLGNLFGVHA